MSRPFRYALSLQPAGGDRIVATARVPADSAWYDGHFPGNPILPGLALIALVEEAVLRFERERINRVSALLKQRGYAPIDGAVGAYAEGLVAVFRDLDEAHARAERAESEFRGVARMQA